MKTAANVEFGECGKALTGGPAMRSTAAWKKAYPLASGKAAKDLMAGERPARV